MKFFYTLLVLLVSCSISIAQEQATQKLDSLAGLYMRSLQSSAVERTWIKTERPVYRSGDMVFFKGFVLHSLSGKPSRKSNILFVDLVDERDHVLQQAMLNAASFKTDGGFILPDTLASGHYWLRAYTRRSLLSADAPMDVQAIYVINALRPDAKELATDLKKEKKLPDDSLRIRFFPEGGTMIGGAETVVAFETKDANGDAVRVSGYLTDADSVVTRFSSNETGLGKLSFFCWTWHPYRLHITRNGKPDLVYTLPKVDLFGAQIGLIEKNGVRKLRVVLEDSIFRRDKLTYVLGVSGDSLCFSAVGRGSYDQVLPEYRFPKGVSELLLFDDRFRLLSRRSFYVQGNETIVQLTADKPQYPAREKATIQLQISDKENRPQVGSFLVKVEDIAREAFYDPIKPASLTKKMMAEFPGTVSGLPERNAGEWELYLLAKEKQPVLLHTVSATEKEDSSFFITGHVEDEKGRAVAGKIITLFGDLKTKIFETDTTDAKGVFCFPFTAYDDQTKFNLQVTDQNGRLYPGKIILENKLQLPKVQTPVNLKQYFIKETIETVRKTMTVQSAKDTVLQKRGKEWLADVTVTGLIKKDPGYDTQKRMSLFSRIIPPEAFAKLPPSGLGNVVFRVPGIHLRNGYVTVNGGNSFGVGAATEPLLVVDGMPIPTDTADKLPGSEPSPLLMALNRIDPSVVEFIEVLTGPEAAMYGSRGGNGVIIVNTRSKLVIDDNSKANGIRNLRLKGFQVPEPFEQRDYSVKEIRNSKIPDSRTLIFWSGDGLTDKEGRATIQFYTADAVATYLVTVTGVTANGVRFQQQIPVSRK